MQLKWTRRAVADLARLHEFLVAMNPAEAARVVQSLSRAPVRLLANPRVGEQLFHFEPREIRRILVTHYEIRYEIVDDSIYVLRLWYTREDR